MELCMNACKKSARQTNALAGMREAYIHKPNANSR